MPNLSIKDVPENWAEALRQRAVRNHRSLQGELMAIIGRAIAQQDEESAGRAMQPAGQVRIVGHDRRGFPIERQGWKTIEQISAEHLARHPEPITQGPLAVDLIREDRDAR